MDIYALHMGLSWAFLVAQPGGLLLVDAGLVRREQTVLKQMQRIGRDDLRAIYLTHAHLDHYGSAAALKRLTGATIIIHEADADDLRHGKTNIGTARGIGRLNKPFIPLAALFIAPEPVEPDVVVRAGDTLDALGLTGEILHTPGHTAGSTTVLMDDGGVRVAFAGDLLTADPDGPHIQRSYATDWAQLPHSLRKLHAAKPDLIYVGHGTRNPLAFADLDGLVQQIQGHGIGPHPD